MFRFKTDRGFTLIELMIVVAIVGILASLAVPNLIRFQARSKQSEVKTNLKAIFNGEKARFAERDGCSTGLGEVGFAPERGNRYRYDLGVVAGGDCALEEARTAALAVQPASPPCAVSADSFKFGPNYLSTALLKNGPGFGSLSFQAASIGNVVPSADTVGNFGTCPVCSFSARGVGNIDIELTADQWYISSEFSDISVGSCTPLQIHLAPGSPVNNRNDINCD